VVISLVFKYYEGMCGGHQNILKIFRPTLYTYHSHKWRGGLKLRAAPIIKLEPSNNICVYVSKLFLTKKNKKLKLENA